MLPVLRAAAAPSTLETPQPPEAEATAAAAFFAEKNTMRAQIAARLAVTKPLFQALAEIGFPSTGPLTLCTDGW